MRTRRAGSRVARRGKFLGAALGLVLASAPGVAQEAPGGTDGALRFLKPWIERQLFGRETSTPEPQVQGPPIPEDLGEAPAEMAAPNPDGVFEEPTPGEATALQPAESGPAAAAAPSTPDTVPPPVMIETPTVPPVEAGPEPLRLAILAARGPATTLRAIAPVADGLKALLGRPVEFIPMPSYSALVDAQVQRRVDGGFFSAAAFTAAESLCTCLDPLVAPRATDMSLGYHAVIVARAGDGVTDIAGLAGKSVAIGGGDSIAGRRMQIAALLADGVDVGAAFGSVVEVASPETAVRLLAAGQVDAAFAWSSLTGVQETGYSRGTLTDLVARGEVAMQDVTIIWRSPLVGHGPFAVPASLAEEDKAKIEGFLTKLSFSNPDAYDLLDPYYGGGFAPVDAQDYAGLSVLVTEDVDAVRLPLRVMSDAVSAPAVGTEAAPVQR